MCTHSQRLTRHRWEQSEERTTREVKPEFNFRSGFSVCVLVCSCNTSVANWHSSPCWKTASSSFQSTLGTDDDAKQEIPGHVPFICTRGKIWTSGDPVCCFSRNELINETQYLFLLKKIKIWKWVRLLCLFPLFSFFFFGYGLWNLIYFFKIKIMAVDCKNNYFLCHVHVVINSKIKWFSHQHLLFHRAVTMLHLKKA